MAADCFCQSKTHVGHTVLVHGEHFSFEIVFKNDFQFDLVHDCLAHNNEQLALLEAAVFKLVFNVGDNFYLAIWVFFELN